MRKISTMIVTLGLVVGAMLAPTAEAGRKKHKKHQKVEKITRPESVEYTSSGSVGTPVGWGELCVQEQGCLTMVVEDGENYVSFEVADTTDTPSPFVVSLDGGASNTAYCGQTAAPIWLNGATEVEIAMASVSLPDCAGVATTGTLNATFSNLP